MVQAGLTWEVQGPSRWVQGGNGIKRMRNSRHGHLVLLDAGILEIWRLNGPTREVENAV